MFTMIASTLLGIDVINTKVNVPHTLVINTRTMSYFIPFSLHFLNHTVDIAFEISSFLLCDQSLVQ